MRRNRFSGLILALLLLAVTKVYAQGYVFGPNVRVNDDPAGIHYHATPHGGQRGVAVRGNTVYCIWRDGRAGNGIWFAKSIDDGQTFLPNEQVDDGYGVAILPTLAVGDDGNIYASWQDMRSPFSFWQVYFSKSTDGGLTFTPDVLVNDTANGIKSHPHRNPSMAVDSAGIIYIAFDDARNDPLLRYDIYFSKSTDGGLTFIPDVMVNDSLPGDTHWRLYPGLAADNAGNVYVVWRDERYHSWNDIYFSKSTDGGITFLPDVVVSDTGSCIYRTDASVNVDGRGYIHCLWCEFDANADVFYSRSTDGGLTFSPHILVNDSIHAPDAQTWPSMCVDDSGIVYSVWEDGPLTSCDINFTLSTDTGDSVFVEPDVKVSDDDSAHWSPSIAVGDSGKVYVLWMDERNGDWDVYFATGVVSGIEETSNYQFSISNYQLSVYPNPFTNTTVFSVQCPVPSDRTKIEISIYDISGRLVKSFSLTTNHSALGTAVSWDGRDDNGESVSIGLYFVEIKVGDKEFKEKVIYLR